MMEPSTRAPLVYVYNLVFKIVIVSNMPVDFVCLFELKLYAPVNSYGYVGTLPIYPKFGHHDFQKVLQI